MYKPEHADLDFWDQCLVQSLWYVSDAEAQKKMISRAFRIAEAMTKQRRKILYREPDQKISDIPEKVEPNDGDVLELPEKRVKGSVSVDNAIIDIKFDGSDMKPGEEYRIDKVAIDEDGAIKDGSDVELIRVNPFLNEGEKI